MEATLEAGEAGKVRFFVFSGFLGFQIGFHLKLCNAGTYTTWKPGSQEAG